jgi:hypothetical protein
MTEDDREKMEGSQNSESSRREYLMMMGLAAGFGPASTTSSDDGSFFQVGDPHSHFGQTWQGDVGDGAGLLVIADPGRTGLAGTNFSTTGQAFGLRGRCDSDTGTGLRGFETSPTGLNRGVDGVTSSSGGQGVRGFADTTIGNATGVYGRTDAPEGTAVFGECRDRTGATTGLYGTTNSANADSVGVFGEAASQGAGIVATTNDSSFY